MGAVLAKFRKAKTTEKQLEELQEKIQQIEKFSLNTQEQKKVVVGHFLAVSIGVYMIAFLGFYFVYFPPTWRERILYSVPMLLFPVVIILLRRLFTWHFQRKLNKNSEKLTVLRAEKKKILEQVMDKETYKVALNLLMRFSDAGNIAKPYPATPHSSNTSIHNAMQAVAAQRRSLADAPRAQNISLSLTPSSRSLVARTMGGTGGGPGAQTVGDPMTTLVPRTPMPMTRHVGQELRRRTPFPIINRQDKNVLERIVDVLVGDGPQDRFAMICKQCFNHNGMALKEDFDYCTFRCAYCSALNQARKERPTAPLLPTQRSSNSIAQLQINRGSASSSSSDDEDSADWETPRGMTKPSGVAEVQTAHLEPEVDNNKQDSSAMDVDLDADEDTDSGSQSMQTKISAACTDLNAELKKLMIEVDSIDEARVGETEKGGMNGTDRDVADSLKA